MNRFDYVKYDKPTQVLQEAFKEVFVNLEKSIMVLPSSRSQSMAVTKLEEAYMWIGKALRDAQIAKNGKAELQEDRKSDGVQP